VVQQSSKVSSRQDNVVIICCHIHYFTHSRVLSEIDSMTMSAPTPE
jgi:hypothetical protein